MRLFLSCSLLWTLYFNVQDKVICLHSKMKTEECVKWLVWAADWIPEFRECLCTHFSVSLTKARILEHGTPKLCNDTTTAPNIVLFGSAQPTCLLVYDCPPWTMDKHEIANQLNSTKWLPKLTSNRILSFGLGTTHSQLLQWGQVIQELLIPTGKTASKKRTLLRTAVKRHSF